MANAELAGRILDAIEENPEAFDMNFWHTDNPNDDDEDNPTAPLLPDVTPACGTTLCVAGWAAHLTGWTLRGIHATKNGASGYTDNIAQSALGLEHDEAGKLFYSRADEALAALREMAGRADAGA